MVPGKAYNGFGYEIHDLSSIPALDVCLEQYLQGDKISVSESCLDEKIYCWLEEPEIRKRRDGHPYLYIQHPSKQCRAYSPSTFFPSSAHISSSRR